MESFVDLAKAIPRSKLNLHLRLENSMQLLKKILKAILPRPVIKWLNDKKERTLHYTWRLIWFIRGKILPYRITNDPYLTSKIHVIHPAKIIYRTLDEFKYLKDHNKTVGGDWDIPLSRFEEDLFYQSFELRIKQNKSWTETQYYNHHLSQIINGEEMWGCRSKAEWDSRCQLLDDIYADIKENGYHSQKIEDYVSVNIGRDGNLLFNDGRHRLTFCKLLGIQEIPIRITVRHAKWVRFKNQIYDYANSKEHRNGKIYAPITHIDLQSVPSLHGHKRFELIRQNLTLPSRGTVLDIGSHWGYFSHKFEELGFDCLAVENDPENLYFLNKLRKAENRNFSVFENSIFLLDTRNIKYDIVLALAIFHHFTKEEKTYNQLTRFLRSLNMKEMYFEPPDPEEPQMQSAFRNYSCEEFVHFVVQNSCLENYKPIGSAEDGRKLYKLW